MLRATVLVSTKDHIASITLNGPEADNLLDEQMAAELRQVCTATGEDDNVYVIMVTGAGKKAFCTSATPGKPYGVATAVGKLEQPVIAVINGDATGEGLELALACDIRLAVPTSHFSLPQIKSGLVPMDGGTQRLPRLVGRAKALELTLTGATIGAEEALEIGLVDRLVPPEGLAAAAEELARGMAGKAPIALRYIKEAVNKGLDLTLEQGLRLEADLYFLLHTTADRTEGIRAFQEKRKPSFRAE